MNSSGAIYDVAVLGLGGVGSAAAWHCARRGVKVLGLEQFAPVHALGSSHGEWRVYREAYFEHPSYVPLALRAGRLWEELEAAAQRPLFRRCGILMVTWPHSAVHQGCLASARQHGLPYRELTATVLTDFFPTLRADAGQVGFFEPRAGAVRVEDSIHAHLALAQAAGATLHFGEKVRRVTDEPHGAGVALETEKGIYRARKLIFCAGAWSGAALAECGLELRPRRVVQAWFAARPEALPPDRPAPVVFIETKDGTLFYGLPPADPAAPDAAWKFAFHNRHEPCDPDAVRRVISPEEITALHEHIERYLPGLVGAVRRASVCLYELSPDEHFVLGPHPHRPAVTLAAGFSGHGFKFVPAIGEILADLSLAGRSAHDLSFFSPTRPRFAGK